MALIVYVVGTSPSIGALDRYIGTNWNYIAKPKIYYHNDDYFVVKFTSMKDRDEVLLSGPHLYYKPLIVQLWELDFSFDNEVLRVIPLWVKLPNLPLNCWGVRSLSRISSGLGNPVYADECTSKMERISYARVLIEMDVTGLLPQAVRVQDPTGRVFDQEVQYDWVPEYCNSCLQVGNDCSRITAKTAPTKNLQKEIPKQKEAIKDVAKEDKEQPKKVVPKWLPRTVMDRENAEETPDVLESEFPPLKSAEEWHNVEQKEVAKSPNKPASEVVEIGNGFSPLATKHGPDQTIMQSIQPERGRSSNVRPDSAPPDQTLTS